MKVCPILRATSLLFAFDVFLLVPSKVDLQHALDFLFSFPAMSEVGGSDSEGASEFLNKALCFIVSHDTYPHLWSQEEETGHKNRCQIPLAAGLNLCGNLGAI